MGFDGFPAFQGEGNREGCGRLEGGDHYVGYSFYSEKNQATVEAG